MQNNTLFRRLLRTRPQGMNYGVPFGYSMMKYLNKRFLSLKIQKKIFLCFVLITLSASLIIGSTAAFLSYKALVKNTTEYVGEYLDEFSKNLEYKTEVVLEKTYSLMSDEELVKVLEQAVSNKEDAFPELKRKQVRELGRKYINGNMGLQAFYLLDQDENLYWYVKYSKDFNSQSVNEKTVRRITEDARARIGRQWGEKCWFASGDGTKVLLGRTLFHPQYVKKKLGTIVFVLDLSFFNIQDNSYIMKENENIAFYNAQSGSLFTNEIVFSMVGKQIGEDNWKKQLINGKSIQNLEKEGEQYLELILSGRDSVWDIFCLIPKRVLLEDSYRLVLWILFTWAIVIIISLSASYYLAGNMTKNLNHLEQNMRKIEEGDFHIRIHPVSYDEIGILCMRFNYMADKIEQLIKKAYDDGIAKQKLQLQVLKAQINPHFLYNSLGSIKCLAKMKGQSEIAEMTTALIEMMRASLSKTSEFQTLDKEIEYIKNYFLLQRFRYGESFRVVYDLDKELGQCIVLDFLLQPLVENSLFHGIDMLKGDGIITIAAKCDEKKLILSVTDNGGGMSAEQMKDILIYDCEKYEGLNSIGVSNVNERIKRYFGEGYGLNYYSRECGGVIVEVVLPLLYSVEEVERYV